MEYKKAEKLIERLRLTNEPLSIEAAEEIRLLLAENNNLRESYNAMLRDLQRAIERVGR